MKKIFHFVFFIGLFVSFSDVSAYKFDFTTVGDIVKEVKKTFAKVETYQAEFNIASEKLGKKMLQSGTIKYRAPDKLLIDFQQPFGQKIVSNGKMMWIYIPSMNVVAEQDLKSDSGFFTANTKSGLKRLFSKYHYRFASKDQPEEKKANGEEIYTLILKQKESRSGYRKLKLWVSKNSKDYFITKATGETSTGKTVDISFYNIRTNVDLPSGIFRFDIPASARVIKNPMISEE